MNINTLLYRVFIFLFFMLAGSLAGARFFSISQSTGIGALLGAFAGVLVFLVEKAISRTQPHVIFGGGVGALAGAFVALGVGRVLGFSNMPPLFILSILILAGHMGFVAGARGIRAFSLAKSSQGLTGASIPKLLDTSSIIDGRIVEMVELGFVGGPLIVPQFVLRELQGIADSTDPLKRARGRRGLSVLERLQSLEEAETRVVDEDYPRIKEVDQKLVAMGKSKSATIVTTDFNLAKVAELQGINVLNVNELSQALRPVVLPGEEIRVTIQKEGKEPGQGVGYLEDGTMVVVEEGAVHMGESIRSLVTSVLQTSAGRMIFTRSPNDGDSLEMPKEGRKVWRRES